MLNIQIQGCNYWKEKIGKADRKCPSENLLIFGRQIIIENIKW